MTELVEPGGGDGAARLAAELTRQALRSAVEDADTVARFRAKLRVVPGSGCVAAGRGELDVPRRRLGEAVEGWRRLTAADLPDGWLR